ncbi:MAG: hypothetical protein K5668_04775 [Lachnospiraceae bacterium]|nr:hypothetical protein [Lachnospiraceae bacterium]
MNYIFNREADTSAACVLGAVLCDTDHIIEYGEYCRKYKAKPDFKEWNSGEYFSKKGTVKVFFHSWEICILSWILLTGLIIRPKGDRLRSFGRLFRIFKGLTIGYTSHMVLDQIGNGMNAKCYFLLYRWLHGWKQKALSE